MFSCLSFDSIMSSFVVVVGENSTLKSECRKLHWKVGLGILDVNFSEKAVFYREKEKIFPNNRHH